MAAKSVHNARLYRISDEQLNAWTAKSIWWHHKGSELFHASQLVLDHVPNLTNIPGFVVGEPVGGLVGGKQLAEISYRMIGLMLRAMAVECWLKGILVGQLDRQSTELKRRLYQEFESTIPDGLESLEGIELLLKEWAKPDVISRMDEVETVALVDDVLAVEKLKDHRKHDLVKLAGVAKVKTTSRTRALLEVLRKLNAQGRYPVPMKAGDVLDVEKVNLAMKDWPELARSISDKYHEVNAENRN